MSEKPVTLSEIEGAYELAKFGDTEPNMGLMSTQHIIYLYRKTNPDEVITDQQIVDLMAANELLIYIGDGIWIMTRDKATAEGIRNGTV